MNRTLATLALACTAASIASAADWTPITQGEDGLNWLVQPGSLRVRTNTDKLQVAVVTTKIILPDPTANVEINDTYVPTTHCAARRGYLAIIDFNNQLVATHPFVFGAGTMASIMAETICTAWRKTS